MATHSGIQEQSTHPHFDIVIVGGGMVGISLSLLLAKQKRWNILLIESGPLDGLAPSASTRSLSFDERSTALSWTSRNIYQTMGLWDKLQPCCSQIRQIHVSDRGHGGLTRICAEETGVDGLGYVIENRLLGSVLTQKLRKEAISLYGNTQIAAIQPLRSGVELRLSSNNPNVDRTPSVIHADLLVIADGANSKTAAKLGIYSQHTSYHQTAVIANVQLGQRHQGIAYERFTDQGPMALLPLTDFQGQYRSSLVWVQPEASATSLVEGSEHEFLEQLQKRFGFRLGRFKQVGSRMAYPLTLTLAKEQIRRNVVLMGNSAHSLHPVAGQGFNLSMRDAAALAATLSAAHQRQRSIGSVDVLDSYYQQQLSDQRNTVMLSNNLSKFFSASSMVTTLGRNLGLLALDGAPQLRQGFAQFGMGMAGGRHG
jgi:2-octaprenyl-6-methoxyphenol hydroxylase